MLSGPVNLDVPNDISGLYINWVTGDSGGAPPTGWDFNPYSNGTSVLFYWGGDVGPDNAGVASDGTLYSVLGSGDTVGSGSTFIQNAQSGTDNWFAGVTGGYLGMQFRNENTGQINYGYVHITTTGPIGFPMQDDSRLRVRPDRRGHHDSLIAPAFLQSIREAEETPPLFLREFSRTAATGGLAAARVA